MTAKPEFTAEEARRIAHDLGLDLAHESFDLEQFRVGLNVELEHGRRDPGTMESDAGS